MASVTAGCASSMGANNSASRNVGMSLNLHILCISTMKNGFTRRRFLSCAAATAVAAGATAPASRIRIGAQTNTWGAPIKPYEHLLEVLDALVKLGYEGFETNYMSLDGMADKAKQCRAAFESRRIEYVAPHTNVKFPKPADAAAQLAEIRRIAGYSAEMGARHLIASGSYARKSADR